MTADWRELANCLGVDTELFFPDRGESNAAAVAVCSGCVVREECLAFALSSNERFGIWGGVSEKRRMAIRRTRRRARADEGASVG